MFTQSQTKKTFRRKSAGAGALSRNRSGSFLLLPQLFEKNCTPSLDSTHSSGDAKYVSVKQEGECDNCVNILHGFTVTLNPLRQLADAEPDSPALSSLRAKNDRKCRVGIIEV